jgi:hypothetical protein
VHRIEGLSAAFVSEFQNFKHYLEEEEDIIEHKL